ncbi:MAG: phosphatidylserine decarboxylase [Bacilli bacterium]
METYINNSPNKGLSFLYNTIIGRIMLKPMVSSKFISNTVAFVLNKKLSTIIIKPFINKVGINIDDYEKNRYDSFNDFFTRKIKSEKRVINLQKSAFISPCDSKVSCYKINNGLTVNIKNSKYSVASIISDKTIAKEYKNGYLLVFRLSVEDYHHYCFIDEGVIDKTYKISGKFHTVNPIVYDKYQVFKENTREVTLISTKNFDKVIYVEVGALMVGKITNIKTRGDFSKGEEKGYFEFGGSTVVLLVKNLIQIDDLILNNTKKGKETCVKYGEKIGEK